MALSIKAAKLTSRVLAKAMAAFLRELKKARDAPTIGRQSLRRLNRTLGGDTSNIEVMGRIRDFDRVARRHGVSYHIEKDLDSNPPKYTVFFKARQTEALTAAFSEYSRKTLGKTADKPSVLGMLRRMKELAKNQVTDRVKNKDRGGHEL